VRQKRAIQLVPSLCSSWPSPASGLSLLYLMGFGLGQDLGDDVVDAQLRRNGVCGMPAITGEHEHIEPQVAQGCHRFFGVWL